MRQVRRIEGHALVIAADNVDTDQIIPARFLKTTGKVGLGARAFHDWRYDSEGKVKPDSPFERGRERRAAVLVAGENFGCGSSREHAVWALVDYGFRAVIAASFADIFQQNATKNGLLPVVLPAPLLERLRVLLAANRDAAITIDLEKTLVTLPDGTPAPFGIDSFARRCLLDGVDEIGYVLQHDAAIARFEASRPAPFDTRLA